MKTTSQFLRIAFSILVVCSNFSSAQIRRAADAPQSLSPEESQKRFRLPDGFRIELVANEPLLADPSAIMIDHRGRFFVCELHGYNLEGHLDIVELNKSGKLDREVRRVRVEGSTLEDAKKARTGTVKRLIDRDGDGLMDSREVWADKLPPCYGMVAYRDGLIVVCGPDILFLADRDNDGRAEIRKTLFSGFDVDVMERAINAPRWGLDNWIYVGTGSGNPTATGPHLKEPVKIGRSDFRFLPDGSAIEAVTGATGTFGQAMTDYGDRFLMTTSVPAMYAVPLERRYLLRNPFVPSPPESTGAAGYNKIFPTSQPHPWRAARGADPNWVKFYGSREAKPQGFFTSGCSPLIYRAEDFPREYWGSYFCCDPSNNLVHRALLNRESAGYRVHRAPEDQQREFLTSTDQWCRPMNLFVGPDGAIYVVDMYREIIEDYSAIPRFLQQQYGLIEGQHHGRIWRVVHESMKHRRWPDLQRAPTKELVALLDGPNAWWRTTAQRLLIEKNDPLAVTLIRNMATECKRPQGRVHALCTLQGLNLLTPETVIGLMKDSDPGVRRHAVRLSEGFLNDEPKVLEQMLKMTNDEAPEVRLQLAMSLGESDNPRVIDALTQLAGGYGQERWMSAAILSSVVDRSHLLIDRILSAEETSEAGRGFLKPLASCIGSRRQSKELDNLLNTVARLEGQERESAMVDIMEGLIDGLGRGEQRRIELRTGVTAIEKLFRSQQISIVRLAFQLAGKVGLGDSPIIVKAIRKSTAVALDATESLDNRITAVRLAANASWPQRKKLAALLNPEHAPEVQVESAKAIAIGTEPDVADTLLDHWTGLSPKAQETITDALFSRPDRLPKLLASMKNGVIPRTSISGLRRVQLLESNHPEIRRTSQSLFERSESRTKVIQQYAKSLELTRSPDRGRLIFEKQCAKCHRLKETGFRVGPDLTGAVNRPDEKLLIDVLDPSRDIKSGYSVYTAVTKNGRAFTGILAEESATSISLRRETAENDTILRKDIGELRESSKSLMPDEMEKLISPQDLADLLGYLRQALGASKPTGVVLFDDERDVVDKFVQGGGTATIWTADKAVGDVSLKITPSQRAASRIPGWSFPIVENPKPGEYRYMRLRWKSPGSKGALVELAAGGRWPPSESPVRRYYAGENTTPWQAQQVSPISPKEWTLVTVDLFKDNGPFTLTGFAPTAMGGPAFFDRIELLRSLDEPAALRE